MQVAGARMSTAPGAPTRPPHNLHVHQPPVVWRGGFRMPPKRLPLQQHQHQQHQPQFFSYAGSVTGASPGGRVDGVAYDSRRNDGGSHVSPATPLPNDIQNLADVKASEAPDGQDTRVLSGIPQMLDGGGGGATRGANEDEAGGNRGAGHLRRAASDAPYRGRFIRDGRSRGRRV